MKLDLATGSSADFGTVVIGTSTTETFVAHNDGSSSTTAVSINVTGAGYAVVGPASGECISGTTVLAAGATCNIRVRLSPTGPGSLPGSVSVTATAGGTPAAITLSGKGKYPTGTIMEYPIPSTSTVTGAPSGLVWGPDGNIWLCDTAVGSMTPTGTYSFLAGSDGGGNGAYDITVGPDQSLWYTLLGTGGIGRVTTAGVLSTPVATNSTLDIGIASGPDGAIWFVQLNAIGRLDRSTQQVSYFNVPTASSSANYITAGPDGALWFGEYKGNKIGRITTTGNFSEIPVPTANSGVSSITVRPIKTSGSPSPMWRRSDGCSSRTTA